MENVKIVEQKFLWNACAHIHLPEFALTAKMLGAKQNLLILFASFVFVDQFLKLKIRQSGGFYICNEGISFGIRIPYLEILLSLSLFILFCAIAFTLKNKRFTLKTLSYIGLIMMAAGAFSNFIDRITIGCVIDYIPLFIKTLPIINLSDILIFTGICLVLISFHRNSEQLVDKYE